MKFKNTLLIIVLFTCGISSCKDRCDDESYRAFGISLTNSNATTVNESSHTFCYKKYKYANHSIPIN